MTETLVKHLLSNKKDILLHMLGPYSLHVELDYEIGTLVRLMHKSMGDLDGNIQLI